MTLLHFWEERTGRWRLCDGSWLDLVCGDLPCIWDLLRFSYCVFFVVVLVALQTEVVSWLSLVEEEDSTLPHSTPLFHAFDPKDSGLRLSTP